MFLMQFMFMNKYQPVNRKFKILKNSMYTNIQFLLFYYTMKLFKSFYKTVVLNKLLFSEKGNCKY